MPDTALLHKLVSLCESRHIHLIVDEAFIDFMPEGSPLTARLPETRYLYLLRSLTKFFAIRVCVSAICCAVTAISSAI